MSRVTMRGTPSRSTILVVADDIGVRDGLDRGSVGV
jgi:hypothetical protein